MSDIAIKVEHLSKLYKIGSSAKGSISETFQGFFSNKKHSPKTTDTDFWALKDISFEIKKGDAVAIIGKNGAGKSTLLKILSKITEPTSGKIEINGRVSSLLEVGTGFHPELTGRENIFLNGTILGMKRVEIKKKFDEIVAFSGIERFIDTPVKRYSSGMYVRLAFAVAAHLEPEILIIDEVLAVGDAEFQKRCLGKMEDVSKTGRTVLFVSHNMQAVQSLCTSGVLLRNGTIDSKGPVDTIIHNYLNKIVKDNLTQSWNDDEYAPGNEFIKIKSASVLPKTLNKFQRINLETAIDIKFEFWNLVPDLMINISLFLWTASGQCVFNIGSNLARLKKGLYESICHIPANFLNDEIYSIEVLFVKDMGVVLYGKQDILAFEVYDDTVRLGWAGKRQGVTRPKFDFSLEEIKKYTT